MTTDHAKLRELASKATPGEWVADEEHRGGYNIHGGWTSISKARTEDMFLTNQPEMGMFESQDDANFAAAANPQTVLGLLDEIDRLRSTNIGDALLDYDRAAQENERLRTRLSTLQSLCIEACDIAAMSLNHLDRNAETKANRIAEIRKEVGGGK